MLFFSYALNIVKSSGRTKNLKFAQTYKWDFSESSHFQVQDSFSPWFTRDGNQYIIKKRKKKERNEHYFWLVPENRKNSLDNRVAATSKCTRTVY